MAGPEEISRQAGDQTRPAEADPYAGFQGHVRRTMASSTPWWPPRASAPSDAPNVVIVLADDLGYSDLGCFGSEIPTPHLDEIAQAGQRYANFHSTPLCSPTRAALLTGHNPHAAGVGVVSNIDPGFPGYSSELRDDQPTVAEILRAQGYGTLMVGKWHLCKDSDLNDAGDRNSWPLQRGFERFYGFLEGITNLHHPHRLYRDNGVVEVDAYPEGYYLTDDLTHQAIKMVSEVKAANPKKPFLLYFAHAAPHAPLHAKASDIEAQRGKYAAGWDAVREQRFRKQREMGLLPDNTELSPRPTEPGAEVPPWSELTETQKRLFAAYMELYAAMVSSIDQSVGRLRQFLQELGEWENTIFLFMSDNGASREGHSNGTSFYWRKPLPGSLDNTITDDDVRHLESGTLGGPTTWPHYPRGWAMACNTPLRLYKVTTYRGGHQVPFILSWPRRASSPGAILNQYAYVTDVLPTILQLTGLKYPPTRNGFPTPPLTGASFAEMVSDPSAPSEHVSQYFECNGNRAFYRDGWEAVTVREFGPPSASSPDRKGLVPPAQDHWALFDVERDPAQCHDLSGAYPALVEELKADWDKAAWENRVYPINEGTGLNWLRRPPSDHSYEAEVRILGGTPTLERYRSAQLTSARPFTISIAANWDRGDEGVLVAHGGQESGYVVYVEDGAVNFVQNDFGRMLRLAPISLEPGDLNVKIEVAPGPSSTWDISVAVNETSVSHADGHPQLSFYLPFEGIDVGIDRRSPVSWELYRRKGPFPYTGSLHSVTYTPGPRMPSAGAEAIERAIALGSLLE